MSALFTRTAPTPETWSPEGTIVSQRYRALEGATILVYAADADRATATCAAACLGCAWRASKNVAHNPMSETDAAMAANAHAAACRAMSRGIPARPDDATADAMIRNHLWNLRSRHEVRVHIADFHAQRVDLQRTTAWIKGAMARLTANEPSLLTATDAGSSGLRFTLCPIPR
ncbi:hypothetical protein [Streptomyces sp. RKAG293]|uniref:hypothetical protein n=1 Tax=Streptomyces sp. RKAG293 TaxID=2893403 RepID=UPI00203383D8|nr:hypothetical protein [Streptomyces sp. RKAG293]MCM2424197.1 hypothetical protein [Streptomyces sp. RKAG293]